MTAGSSAASPELTVRAAEETVRSRSSKPALPTGSEPKASQPALRDDDDQDDGDVVDAEIVDDEPGPLSEPENPTGDTSPMVTRPGRVPTDDKIGPDVDEADAEQSGDRTEAEKGRRVTDPWLSACSSVSDALKTGAMTSDPGLRETLKERCMRVLEMIYSIEAPGRTTVVNMRDHHNDPPVHRQGRVHRPRAEAGCVAGEAEGV
jgi:hypothetical protein